VSELNVVGHIWGSYMYAIQFILPPTGLTLNRVLSQWAEPKPFVIGPCELWSPNHNTL